MRELLKNNTHAACIDAVIAADSIHASILKQGSRRIVDATQMRPFLNFARLSTTGQKVFIISHSQLPVEPYASTTETTHYLLRQLALTERGAKPQAHEFAPLTLTKRNGFHAAGYPGEDGAAHLQHLRNIAVLWSHLKQHRHRDGSTSPDASTER